MANVDQCHKQIVRALQKAGWLIQREQVPLAGLDEENSLFVDILAAPPQNGRQADVSLFLEVKCFPQERKDTTELYTALGQYIIYRGRIERSSQTPELYLAVPEVPFERVFNTPVLDTLQRNGIKMVVIDIEREEIIRWLK